MFSYLYILIMCKRSYALIYSYYEHKEALSAERVTSSSSQRNAEDTTHERWLDMPVETAYDRYFYPHGKLSVFGGKSCVIREDRPSAT